MGDVVTTYLQVFNSLSQLLWWLGPSKPVVCDCQCGELDQRVSNTCSGLVKELFQYCLNNDNPSSGTTTTTTVAVRETGGFWWLWLILILVVFAAGLVVGRFGLPTTGRARRAAPLALAGGSGDPSPPRVRRGVVA